MPGPDAADPIEARTAAAEVAATGLPPDVVAARLAEVLRPQRRARLEAALGGRTYAVVPVVEGLVDRGNVNAVMRSAEALGYQAFHLIQGDRRFKTSKRTSQGAEKWLDVYRWQTPAACAAHLRARGYQVVAMHLDEAARPIEAFDFTRRTALVFGNERDGLSPALLALADARCRLPMMGLAQSFNISVAAALSLYHAYRDRLARQGRHGDLLPAERQVLRAAFYMRSVRRPDAYLRPDACPEAG